MAASMSRRPRGGIARPFAALAWLFSTALLGVTPLAHGSVYFKYRVVAETGQNNFTAFGTGPAINSAGKVALIGNYTSGDSVFLWKPTTGVTDIASSLPSSSRTFGDGAKINDWDDVAVWTRHIVAGWGLRKRPR